MATSTQTNILIYSPNKREPNIQKKPYHSSKTRQQAYHQEQENHFMNKALTTYLTGGLNKQYACSCECMTYLTYFSTTQNLWH